MNRTILVQLVREEDGVLSFEWTLLVVLLVVGIVSGVAAGRDVMIDELGDVMQAVIAFDQSYSFAGIPGVLDASSYTDVMPEFTQCDRDVIPTVGGQGFGIWDMEGDG